MAANQASGKRAKRLRTAVEVLKAGPQSRSNDYEKLLRSRGQYVGWERNDPTKRGKKGINSPRVLLSCK
eukprot:3783970-Alexandrium_andersonii.AAC.1